jgi:TrmH family RNA methyltransferase
MIQQISSIHNPGIKNLLQLTEKSRIRKQQKLFIIEGGREISRALDSGFQLESCYFYPEILTKDSRNVLNSLPKDVRLFEVSQAVYSKIAYRENVDGLVVIAKMRDRKPEDLNLNDNPLILILETVEKPGNLGAILRTADAAGLDAVFICDSQTDIYNPNVVRSSLGCLFSNQIVHCESPQAITFLKEKSIRIFAAALQNSVNYHHEDFTAGTAFVMGSEADGLTEIWRKEADRIIQIPMSGIADSLNVSVSAGILVFEAVRQRSIAKK